MSPLPGSFAARSSRSSPQGFGLVYSSEPLYHARGPTWR